MPTEEEEILKIANEIAMRHGRDSVKLEELSETDKILIQMHKAAEGILGELSGIQPLGIKTKAANFFRNLFHGLRR